MMSLLLPAFGWGTEPVWSGAMLGPSVPAGGLDISVPRTSDALCHFVPGSFSAWGLPSQPRALPHSWPSAAPLALLKQRQFVFCVFCLPFILPSFTGLSPGPEGDSLLPSQTRLKPLFHRKEGRGLYTGLHTAPTPAALSLPGARARREASILSADWSPPDICRVCGGSPMGGHHHRGLASPAPGDSALSHQFTLGDSHHAESEWGSSWVIRCLMSVQVSKRSHPSSPCP